MYLEALIRAFWGAVIVFVAAFSIASCAAEEIPADRGGKSDDQSVSPVAKHYE